MRTARSTESGHSTLTGWESSDGHWSIDTHDRLKESIDTHDRLGKEHACKKDGLRQPRRSFKFSGGLGFPVMFEDAASVERTNSTLSEMSMDDSTAHSMDSCCSDSETKSDTWDELSGGDETESLCAQSLLGDTYRSDLEVIADTSLCAQSDAGSLHLPHKQQRRLLCDSYRSDLEVIADTSLCAQSDAGSLHLPHKQQRRLLCDSYRSDLEGMADTSLCAQSDAGSLHLPYKQQRRQIHQRTRPPKLVNAPKEQFAGRINKCSTIYSGKLYHL
jgi:hypothetical protein